MKIPKQTLKPAQKAVLKYGAKGLRKIGLGRLAKTGAKTAAKVAGLTIPGLQYLMAASLLSDVSGMFGGPTIEGGVARAFGKSEHQLQNKQDQENARAAAIMTDWSNAQQMREGPKVSQSTLAAMQMLEERFNPEMSTPAASGGGQYGMAMANALAKQSGNQVSAAQLYRAVRPEVPQDSRMLMYPSLWDGGDQE